MSQLTVNTIQLGQSATPANNFVLTVPSPEDGTIKLSRGNVGSTTQDVISVDAAGFVSFPIGSDGGKVVQIVEGSTTTTVTISTTTPTDTGLSVSITPSSASNKVLILVAQNAYLYRQQSSQQSNIKLLRDSTTLYSGSSADSYIAVGNSTYVQLISTWSFYYLDSPSTTSSVTYKTQGNPISVSNSGFLQFQNGSARSSILALEILP